MGKAQVTGLDDDCTSAVLGEAKANEQGLLVVAAAGNSGYRGGNTVDCPGRLRETLCVAAYNRRGQISNFSSGGEDLLAFHRLKSDTSTRPSRFASTSRYG